VHSSLAAVGGFFTTRAASIKTSAIKTPHTLFINPPFIDSLALIMQNGERYATGCFLGMRISFFMR